MYRLRCCMIITTAVSIVACSKTDNVDAAAAPAAPAANAVTTSNATPRFQKIETCGLVSEQEAEAIVGKGLEPPMAKNTFDCWYLKEGGKDFGAVEVMTRVGVEMFRSPAEFDASVAKGVADLNSNMKEAGGAAAALVRVNDVGESAFYADPSLFVLKNGRMLTVVAPQPIAVAFAGKAIARMP